jgi:anti-sigma factor ChrR (cupin superfamily)
MIRTAFPSHETLCAFAPGNPRESELGEVAEHLVACSECEERISRLDRSTDAFADVLRLIGDFGVEAIRHDSIQL